jgi:hypothetical protein
MDIDMEMNMDMDIQWTWTWTSTAMDMVIRYFREKSFISTIGVTPISE